MYAKNIRVAAADPALENAQLFSPRIHAWLTCMIWITAAMLFASCRINGQSLRTAGAAAPSSQTATRAALAAGYGKLPLSFEANQGQSDPQVRFLSRGNGYSLFLTGKEAVLALRRPADERKGVEAHERSADGHRMPSFKTDVVRMQLAGASPDLKVSGADKLPGTANYFIGSDPARWQSGMATYGKVQYQGVYPGVDLVYHGDQQQLEYDFVVAPYADTKLIRVQFEGAKKLKLDPSGDLEVIARNGKIAFHRPVIYQDTDGRRQPIGGHFTLVAKNAVGFELDAYDHSKRLVIDPTIVYSTYFGPSGESYGIATDSNGNAYVVGTTDATNFPFTAGAYQTTLGTAYEAAYIAKFNSSGTQLVYSTYLGGGNESTWAAGIAVDSSGNAYVTGGTDSPNFPVTSGAYQTTFYGSPHPFGSAFVTKLNATGTNLVYSTFLSGPPLTSGPLTGDTDSAGIGIALDATGDAYVTGSTFTGGFPITAGAFDFAGISYGGSFVSKLSADGSTLVYSAFIGDDQTTSICVDKNDDAYVAGSTSDIDFPATAGAFQTSSNGNQMYNNATVAELNASGSALVYATYLGGSGPAPGDAINGIAVDNSGSAYVTGKATSSDFPVTTGAFQTVNNGAANGTYNAFVTKLNASGSGLVYSTFVGGSGGGSAGGGGDYANGIAIDTAGDAYITGAAVSLNFPTTSNAFQGSNHAPAGSSNAFVTEVNPSGSGLLFSTYLGGNDQDFATAIATDTSGNAYVTGSTSSYNFPVTSGVYQTTYPTGGAIFVAKALLGSSSTGGTPIGTTTSLTADANPQLVGVKVTFTASVQPSSGTGVPTGTVTFSVDGGTGIPEALDSSAHATYATSTLTAGTHTIRASYSGNSSYASSSATPLTEIIIGPAASIAVVSGSGQTTAYGSSFTSPLVVVVKDANGNPVPGVVVSFTGAGLGFSSSTATTGSNGEASMTATATGSGSLTAAASISGVSGAANFTLTATKVMLTVTAASVSVAYGQPIPALTYTVSGFVNGDTSSVLSGTPSETTTATQSSAAGTYPITIAQGTLAAANYTFTFVDGTLTITSLGAAATPTFSPTGGTYTSAQSVSISDTTPGAAIYYTTNSMTPTSGSAKYTSAIAVSSTETIEAIAIAPGYGNSTAATATYTINLPAASFTLAASPSSAMVKPGQSATFTLTVTPQNGFAQAVSFSCSGLPSTDSCSFAPSSVTPSGAAVSSTMTVLTTQSAANSRLPLEKAGAGFVLALLLWPFGRRRIWRGLAIVLLLIAGFAAAGCSLPKPQNYTIRVTATGGGVTQTSSISLTVAE